METIVRKFFERYESIFNRTLRGDTDMDEAAALYAPEFIAASPAGVMTGRTTIHSSKYLRKAMRAIGRYGRRKCGYAISASPLWMTIIALTMLPWTATYARKDQLHVAIDFDVHYFVQKLDGEAKVFGWVSGDEQALLRMHGIT